MRRLSIEEQIRHAVERCETKLKTTPTHISINPKACDDAEDVIQELGLKPIVSKAVHPFQLAPFGEGARSIDPPHPSIIGGSGR